MSALARPVFRDQKCSVATIRRAPGPDPARPKPPGTDRESSPRTGRHRLNLPAGPLNWRRHPLAPDRLPVGKSTDDLAFARAATRRILKSSCAPNSTVARNLVPSHSPFAPSGRAARTPHASAMPPAATTGTSGAASHTSTMVLTVDQTWPPDSTPRATMISVPKYAARGASSGVATVWMTIAPAFLALRR